MKNQSLVVEYAQYLPLSPQLYRCYNALSSLDSACSELFFVFGNGAVE